MHRKQFVTSCVDSTGELISAMQDGAREITRATFRKHVDTDELSRIEEQLGYFLHGSQGLTMARDWHVGYYKSTYNGQPCVYFDHSRIEYIFC